MQRKCRHTYWYWSLKSLGHAKLRMRGGQGWQRLCSYFVAKSPAVIMTAVSLVAKSHYRQTARVAKAFLTAGGSKINPKQNLVTSSGSSQMVTECWQRGLQTCAKKMPKISVDCPDLWLSNCSCHLGCRTRRKCSCIAVAHFACLARLACIV